MVSHTHNIEAITRLRACARVYLLLVYARVRLYNFISLPRSRSVHVLHFLCCCLLALFMLNVMEPHTPGTGTLTASTGGCVFGCTPTHRHCSPRCAAEKTFVFRFCANGTQTHTLLLMLARGVLLRRVSYILISGCARAAAAALLQSAVCVRVCADPMV